MKNEVEMFEDEARTGSYLLAQGLDRPHEHVVGLIKQYQSDFEDFGELPRTMRKSTGGRPAVEYMLNFDQVVFLVSLLRNNNHTVKLMKGIIEKGDIVAVLKTLKTFDTDDINVKFVYAAVDSQGRVKIGISNNPEKRIKNLNIGNADELTLVYTKRADLPGHQSEVVLHKKCREYRIHGEWFTKEATRRLA